MSTADSTEQLVLAFVEIHGDLMRKVDRLMSREGASFARARLLLMLDKRGPKRATDIAATLGQAPRTVTEAIDALERDSLVARKSDPSDRRAKLVYLTDAGRKTLAASEPLRHEIIARTFGTLDASEQETMQAILAKLSDAIAAIDEG